MGAAATVGRKAIWIANGIVNTIVLIVILALLSLGCYAMWDAGQVYSAASAARYTAYKPTAENDGLSFQQLQAINPEVFSWLTVYGTHIDYPVTQGQDNLKYLNADAKGKYSLTGSIFMDADNDKDFSDFNSILYGHHMEKDVMFGEIGSFADKSYFDSHQYGNLYYEGKDHGIAFFAFTQRDGYDISVYTANVTGAQRQQSYLDSLLNQAVYSRDLGVTIADHIVLLSTCSDSSTNGRDILIGVITDKVYKDPFQTAAAITNGKAPQGADSQGGILSKIPRDQLVLIIALIVLLLAIIMLAVMRNRRRSKRNERKGENI